MSRVRFNPPAAMSFADYADQERSRLNRELEFLKDVNNTAKAMGYTFEGRMDTMNLLRGIAVKAHNWTAEKHNGQQQSTPDADMIAVAIKQVAKTHMIPCTAVPQAAAPAPGL